ncbi:hypothetical protein SLV14_003533 [Streptomyces sp. Je 1-4]|uniref:hypothetical protein n=1 Tax=Streptomyces TaxID=1883 RepID=UPI0021D93583|nr:MULTISPECIES: hypothetical protein [unclassified Streptomyces]UYB40859.1 hypothetical protein SLV14_003533 [Streptomyces sp. Je 1-4]UZQ37015.1 hypothetical protein SLV14N_003533 [Streptomyces sp. Je 1-4] [Streptomyces sp. Je 1-4 4N24]UZQ44432.1 hypothetical protein SLV14NA_003533 [Streptomyces sp. Je 1-4] [Streptomyces sp. Je 1-4 4N24_ara]
MGHLARAGSADYVLHPESGHVALGTAQLGTLVNVFVPECLVAHWWEHLPDNRTAFRLRISLLFVPGVAVMNVPWQLR